MNIQEIGMAFSIGNAIYVHRNRIGNFLLKYKLGRMFLGIILTPFFIVLFVMLYRMAKDPEWVRIMTKVNAQKKISDYC